jgi:hypothetical protein
VFVLIKWVTGPYFHRVDPGPTSLPSAMKIAIVTYLALQWIAFLWLALPLDRQAVAARAADRLRWPVVYRVGGVLLVLGPDGQLERDHVHLQLVDPEHGLLGQRHPRLDDPGDPRAQAPEPWLFTAGAYSVFFVAMPIAGCWLMRKIRARHPRIGTLGLLASVLGLLFVLETILKGFFWMRMGLYTYPATPDILVLNPSHYYKYPLLESLIWGAGLTAITWVRWSKNDRGETIAERGASEINATDGAKTGIRLMATVGCCYSLILVCFWIPYWLLWSPHAEKFPLDIQKRSYLTDGLCGPGTHRACPDPNVPYFREHSVTITPDGNLYIPPGVKLPNGPTTFQEAARREARR